MLQPPEEQFDDPSLKAAIRRVWAEERAPRELRQRVSRTLAGAEAQSVPMRIGWRPAFGLAAAALVLIAVGVALRFAKTSATPGPVGPGPVATSLSPAFADALVSRHDECCTIGDKHHMPGIAADPDNFAEVRGGLEKRLGIPVLCTNLPAGGPWHFDGGSICPVGNNDSGHLVFSKPADATHRQFVSVFSLPRTLKDGTTVDHDATQMDRDHAIAGFVTSRCFYCVVGSSDDGSLTLDDVRKLSNDLRSDIALGPERQSLALVDRR